MDGDDECKPNTLQTSCGSDVSVPPIDMLTSNQPPLTQHISIPRDLSQLSCEAYTAGLVEGVLDGLEVVSAIPCELFAHITDLNSIAGARNSPYSPDGSIPEPDGDIDQVGSGGHG